MKCTYSHRERNNKDNSDINNLDNRKIADLIKNQNPEFLIANKIYKNYLI